MEKNIYLSIFILTVSLFFAGAQAQGEEALTWQDCIKEAAINHPDLISAEENIKQYKAAEGIASSGLFPQVDASAAASRKRTITTTSGKTTEKTANSFSYDLSATQLIFDASKTGAAKSAALQDIKASEYNYKFVSSDVRYRLRAAFIKVVRAQALLNITNEIYNIRRGNLELIALRYESGLEHRGAFLNAEANSSQAKIEIAQAARSLEAAQRELCKEMGRDIFSLVKVSGSFVVDDAVLEKPDFEALAKKHPSLGKLIAQKNSAYFGIKQKEADYFPYVSATAAAGKSGSDWQAEDEQYGAGVSLSFPIFEGGLRKAEVNRAQAIFNQAKENQRSAQDAIALELEQAWAGLQDDIENVLVQKKFLDAALERAGIAEAQYALGLIQFDNWIIIEDNLVGSKKAFLDAQANALLSEAKWIQAKGDILEYEN